MTITYVIPGATPLDQLSPTTLDGLPNNDANDDCVPTSIAEGLHILTGNTFDGDELKDAVYGAGYVGFQAAADYVRYCADQGVSLTPHDDTQAGLIATIHAEVGAGHPVVVTMPSMWGTAPTDPVHPSGYTHVGVMVGDGPGTLRCMNPWGGFWQDQPDDWWAARLCYGQVWIMQKVSATVSSVPAGWTDDGTQLTAPNGETCTLGFRDFVLNAAGGWQPWNWPLQSAYGADPLEISNPALGGGTRQVFRATVLEWTSARSVFAAWVGQEFIAVQEALATEQASASAANAQVSALQTQVAQLTSQIKQLENQTPAPVPPAPLTPVEQAAIALGNALKAFLAS